MRRTIFRPVAAAIIAAAGPVACTTPLPVADPHAALADPSLGPRKHMGAMVELDARPVDPAYVEELHGLIWKIGYTPDVREAAFDRLVRADLDGLERTIRQRLPRMAPREWQERLCELIADHGWTDLSPALVSAWAVPIGFVDDLVRAEYVALTRLYGPDGVIDEVFVIMVEASKPYEIGLRTRAWSLLLRLGQEQRLRELLADHTADKAPADDAMLADIAAAVVQLGVLPRTREEILWVRALRTPEHRAFWDEAVEVVATLGLDGREMIETRDLPVLVAAARHRPDLLAADPSSLQARLAADLADRTHHINQDRFAGFPGVYGQSLGAHDKLTWGDLAAMILAREALDVPQVVAHLFDYAERDRADESCEYGGVIALDHLGRFEVLEFPPRIRRHDNEFMAPQAMFDSAYTALFHFHMHVQRYRNTKHAGPGLGDINYADNTRANCLVFTFVNRDTLNVDFYRYGRVIVDLGEVHRPGS